jgi:hypothetical protein|tara:strand:- start:139 stop:327 length:189 start_codon:yes stop_codon:yes gene_type:complete
MIIDDRGELDLTKQLEVKNEKIESLLKEIDILRDQHQIEMLEKDVEIGRLMKKINEKGFYGT